MKRSQAIEQLKAVYKVLAEDLNEIVAYGKKSPSPFAHRTLVRTHFALMEGLAFQLRQVTLASLQRKGVLSPEEILLLKEERPALKKNGKVESIDSHQRPLPNLLFSIRCYVKNHGATYEPDTSNSGWAAMREFVQIRNRVTHPKSTEDLDLDDKQLQYVADAASWWKATMLGMFRACEEADRFWRARLDKA